MARKPAPKTPPSLLAAIPVQNPLARSSPVPGGLRLTAPLQPSRLSRLLRAPAREKTFELDALGTEIWRACDGRTSVEQIITAFARTHRVNLRQSQISVTTYLNTLLARNLIALVRPAN